ncbi:oligoendopeptidase F [Halarchaeum nitratireducens]|uniref:Oligoendopeptidase F n=1 Tax=Halarchaeum nitratireducens TaxID=489913 RepID=A0A830G7Q6_9EURY|nr:MULTISPECIES: oligoendopeptidase F [Halarchaeum]MBP2251217.1 oligoendopeptidase F [Halarchaeum solikamskense]GGN06790.1 oligoendopeptidase F [Halarchaeum nitratireducens]
MSTVPEREEIDAADKWDLESVYDSVEAWEDDFEAAKAGIEELREYEGRVAGDGETLLEFLEAYEDVARTVSTLSAYARMRADEDTRDQEAQALKSRGSALASKLSSATSFLEPELQSLDRDELDRMVDATDGLELYEHYLDDVFRMKAHTRSAEVEAVISEFGEVLGAPGEVYGMLTNADLEFPTVEGPDGEDVTITQANLTTLLQERDRAFRRTVHESFYDRISEVRNTIGSSLQYSTKADVKRAQVRGYDTAREAALDGPNIPVEVYDNLVETVRENRDALHRHAELKRRALDVDELEMWDLYMPLTDAEEPEIDYETACDYVVDAVAPLGEDYQERVADGLDSGWVDVYENKGKRSGAYSGGTYDTQPFILMNYQGDLDSVYTLAHELGHSLHSQLSSEHQPYVYNDYEIFVAEVASTVNESLLTHYLLEHTDDPALRAHVLDQYLERFRSTLFRQTLFADFEHTIHAMEERGEPLTPDALDEAYGDLKREFYEPAHVDDRIAREWMRIPHFYYSYYVYQYSTGISAAVALTRDILADDGDAAEAYVDFLTRGSTAYPLELLQDAGVDMSSPAPIESAIDVYRDYLDRAEDLLL